MPESNPPTPDERARATRAPHALVVEDDPIFSRALVDAIAKIGPQWSTHVFATGGEALEFCQNPDTVLDLALVDLGLPDVDGLEVIRAFRSRFHTEPVMVVSVLSSQAPVTRAIRAGATGYILKGDSSLTIARAIEQVMAGIYPISPALAVYLFKLAGQVPGASDEAFPKLTNREAELLRHLADAKTYMEAAEEMGVGLSTIQTYIRQLYRKLNVHSQMQAVTQARKQGLI